MRPKRNSINAIHSDSRYAVCAMREIANAIDLAFIFESLCNFSESRGKIGSDRGRSRTIESDRLRAKGQFSGGSENYITHFCVRFYSSFFLQAFKIKSIFV